jgi:hypothetical protein
MLFVAGGDADPNILCLLQRLAGRELPYLALLVGISSAPRLLWHLAEDRLWVDEVEVRPTALFLRYDVFTHAQDRRTESQRRASAWYHTLLSWALAHEEVAFPNRGYDSRHASKPYVLRLARRLGLATPDSLVTNDPRALDGLEHRRWIVKPVTGGEYTRVLTDALEEEDWRRRWAEEPTILQQRLVAPDLRVYRIGGAWFAFTLHSDAIDYRATADVAISAVPVPAALTEPLRRLMDGLGLDFGAADFKACPETGRPLFLEVNSAPMFAAFDNVVAGALSDAILDWALIGVNKQLHTAGFSSGPLSMRVKTCK